jgi:hypothetical protein
MRKTALFFVLPLLASCNAVFMPQRQNVTINSAQPKSTIYLNNVETEEGPQKLTRSDQYQVVVKTPDYKDEYYVITPTHRPGFYAVGILLDIPFLYGLIIDPMLPKCRAFEQVIDLPPSTKLLDRTKDEKYIDLSDISVDVKDENKDIVVLDVPLKRNVGDDDPYADADEKRSESDDKAELTEDKTEKKKSLLDDDKKIGFVDVKYSDEIYNTLKKTNYIDTVNKIFSDNNNTLVLKGVIKKFTTYIVHYNNYAFGTYYKSKIDITWYIKNTYGEILDSLNTTEMSGEFLGAISDIYAKMIGDAVEASYLRLHSNQRFVKYTKMETDFSISDPELSIPAPTHVVTKKTEAAAACVIVKTKDGHGSGFAISNDGYILTNYHVIAGRITDKPNDVTIITSENQELPGTIVRYNKFRDIALIKVDKKFDFAFNCSNVKSFEKLDDVYTIGAPKSIELGQSISAGIISNERNNNNNVLLQLGMSVNAGNSGGPLFNTDGVLDGVVCAKLIGVNTEGVAFAIPSYLIQGYLNIKYN